MLQVVGAQRFARVANSIREVKDKGLQSELRRSAVRGSRHVEGEVFRSTDRYMPRGYERTFRAAFDSRREVRSVGHGARVTAIFSARGVATDRDVRSLEAGRIRHPVFGRTRRVRRHWAYRATSIPNPWVVQRIRPGFVTEPADRAAPQVRREFVGAIDRIEAKLRGAV